MNMKSLKYIFLMMSVMVQVPLYAQHHKSHHHDNQFDFSVYAGANFCQIDGDGSGRYDKLGYRAGLNTSFPLGDNPDFRMVVELGYTVKGSYVNSIDRTISLNYVEIPILLTHQILDGHLRYGIGWTPAILAKANVEDSGRPAFEMNQNYKRLDVMPLCLDLRYKLDGGLGFGMRWSMSMLNIAHENGAGVYKLFRWNKGQFNRYITLGMSYTF